MSKITGRFTLIEDQLILEPHEKTSPKPGEVLPWYWVGDPSWKGGPIVTAGDLLFIPNQKKVGQYILSCISDPHLAIDVQTTINKATEKAMAGLRTLKRLAKA